MVLHLSISEEKTLVEIDRFLVAGCMQSGLTLTDWVKWDE